MSKRFILVALVAMAVAGCTSPSTTTTTTATSATTATTATTAPATTATTTPTTPTSASLGPAPGPLDDHSVTSACGTELWAKKTLQDAGASQVDPNPVALTSVASLGPASGAGGSARVGIELHTYTFTGKLVEDKLEGDDDYHVVMQDASGKTLVTEYPAPVCDTGANTYAQGLIASARQAFAASCGTPSASSFTPLKGTATVIGVGFYDRDHNQTGRDVLSNGYDAELHPVIGFSGGCG